MFFAQCPAFASVCPDTFLDSTLVPFPSPLHVGVSFGCPPSKWLSALGLYFPFCLEPCFFPSDPPLMQWGASLPFLEIFMVQLDKALSNPIWSQMIQLGAGEWIGDLLRSLLAWIILWSIKKHLNLAWPLCLEDKSSNKVMGRDSSKAGGNFCGRM